jgi:hypothetical protein
VNHDEIQQGILHHTMENPFYIFAMLPEVIFWSVCGAAIIMAGTKETGGE